MEQYSYFMVRNKNEGTLGWRNALIVCIMKIYYSRISLYENFLYIVLYLMHEETV